MSIRSRRRPKRESIHKTRVITRAKSARTMSEKVRWNLRFHPSVSDVVEDTCDELGMTRNAVIRRAIGIMQACDQARRRGQWIGATDDRESLDVVIVPPV